MSELPFDRRAWQNDPEPPDGEWFPEDEEPEEETDDQNPYPYGTQAYHTWNSRRRRGSEGFGLAPDADLEAQYEDRHGIGDDLFYKEGIIESLYDGPEEEEPDIYADTYSEE